MIELVKEVRERSGAPMGECKSALDEAAGNVERALDILQVRGAAKAVQLGGRITTEGGLHTYLHGNRIAVMLEVTCNTDWVAHTAEFKTFCDETAMHIAATNPKYLDAANVPPEALAKQLDIFEEQLRGSKVPDAQRERVVHGKLSKWYAEVCLLNQESVVQPKKTIEQLRATLAANCGENIQIRRFLRWELGEGIGAAPRLRVDTAGTTGSAEVVFAGLDRDHEAVEKGA